MTPTPSHPRPVDSRDAPTRADGPPRRRAARRWAAAGLITALSVVLLAACGSDRPDGPGTDPLASTTATVVIERSRFEPASVTVPPGTTVRWTNLDPFDHTVTATGGPLTYDSGRFGEQETFEVTFTEPGTYAYVCTLHPTMRGTVTVG